MNRNLFCLGFALIAFACPVVRGSLAPYEFATVSNSITGNENLSAVANNGNVFVCVGSSDSPVLAVNTNNFAAFAANNNGGGYLLVSGGWTNTLKSSIKYNYLNCVAAQPNGFIASGTSNTVFVSSDGVNWTNWGSVLGAGNNTIPVEGLAYNPISGTYAAALAIYEASWTTNPVSTNVWQAGVINGSSFAESFRAVGSFGSSNMMLCGILGDIHVSTDGGRTWNVSQQENLNYPNLLSVASDGGSNVVCAGDYSLLEVSTNGGPNASSWYFQTNFNNFGPADSSTNFNVVTYNPTETSFLAAGTLGANGLIMTAYRPTTTANWFWTRQTNLLMLQNGQLVPLTTGLQALNGAVFANSGFFQGIALLVGDSGTVVIGGTAPEPAINSLNLDVTNVLTNPLANAPLQATVFTDTYHPANVLTVDWFTKSTGGTPVALNTATYQPTNENCGTYTNWAQVRDLRTGFVSPIRTPFAFTIIPGAPGNPMSSTNCDPAGQQFGMCAPTPISVTVLTNAANPPGTIQVNWYDSGKNLAGTTELPVNGVMTYPAFVSPTAPGIYTYYAQATNPATGFVSTNMTALTYQVNPLPEWTTTNAISTNVVMANPQVNPQIPSPGITNLSNITGIEPGATVVYDWYTNGDPTVATFENPNAPFALTATASPGVVEPASGVVPFIPTNVVCGSYTYYVRARVAVAGFSSCACQSTNLIPVTFTLFPPVPGGLVQNFTNVLIGFFQTNMPIWVDVLTNAANPASSFKVNWYTEAQGSNDSDYLNNVSSGVTNLSNRFFITPNGGQCDVFTNWAETMVVQSGLVSPTRAPVEYVIIPAAPTAVGDMDVTNCIQVPAPTFTVTVSNVQTANWYVVPGGALAASGASSFTPTNTSVGTWQFSAQAYDPGSGLVSTGAVVATLSLYDCSSPLSVNLNSANGTGTIQWPGNLTLLSATNLTPPIVWSSVSTGSVFSAPYNSYTFTNTNPPVEYFRLTN